MSIEHLGIRKLPHEKLSWLISAASFFRGLHTPLRRWCLELEGRSEECHLMACRWEAANHETETQEQTDPTKDKARST